jgi:hypothetical protein
MSRSTSLKAGVGVAQEALPLLGVLDGLGLLLFGLGQGHLLLLGQLLEAEVQLLLDLAAAGLHRGEALVVALHPALHAAHGLQHVVDLHRDVRVVAAGDLGELRQLLGDLGELGLLGLLVLLDLGQRLLERGDLGLQGVDLVGQALAVLLGVVGAGRAEVGGAHEEGADASRGAHFSMNSARRFCSHAASVEAESMGSASPLLMMSSFEPGTPSFFR